ncbi:hypothetical protein SO694_00117022 [Aureococcus anophagefferens]|uniref:Uncharacterized protein n=1 Tax=Aureococcus anophagefferens TaxID=44056 RepID=A0ABR1FWR1_AURAN
MGRLASVGRCVAVVVYGLAVIAATAYVWDYVVDRSRFADYLQGARDIAYDERRGRLVVSALHADSVAVLDARGEDIALSGLYVDHERFGNAHGFAYDADRELVFAASYTKHSLAALDVGAPRRGGAVVGWVEDGVALHSATHASYDAARRLVFVDAAGGHGRSDDHDNAEHRDEQARGLGHSLAVVDAADPARLRVVGRLTDWGDERGRGNGDAYPVYCVADAPRQLVYVSNDKAATLEVVDVADPARPVKVGEVYDARIDYVSQLAFDAEARVLYAASQKADSFAVVNVTDPRNPALLAVLVDHEVLDGATGVALDVRRKLAFVAAEYAGVVAVVDVADPRAPAVAGSVGHDLLEGGEAVAYDATRALAFVASRTSAAVVAVDVSDPARPSVDRSLCTKRPKAFPAYVALALAAAVAAAHLALICGLRSLRARRDAEKNAYVMVDTFDELGDDDDDDGIELGAVDAEPEDTTPPEKEPEKAADAPPPPPEASPEPPLAKRD